MPALNEATGIAAALRPMQPFRASGHEVIVVDGGSADATLEQAAPLADRALVAERGRARQMNAGAAVARGAILWFVHADVIVPPAGERRVIHAIRDRGKLWGRFGVRLSGQAPLLRIVERMMNWRSCLTGIATGDQAIFVRRGVFDAVGGFPEIPLMEDIAFSRRLKHHGRPACIPDPVTASSRLWEAQGVLHTVLLMWRLRLAYALGADPAALASRYEGRAGAVRYPARRRSSPMLNSKGRPRSRRSSGPG